jgi:hypothetical protein
LATSHDFDGSMSIASSLVPTTAGTMVFTTTSAFAYLPLITATSGNPTSVKCVGLVKSVTKTTAAWLAGQSLTVGTGLTFAVTTAGDMSQASAYDAATAASTTGDVIMRLPCVGA